MIRSSGHHASRKEKWTALLAALRIVTNLQDTVGKPHFDEGLSEGSEARVAGSCRTIINADNDRARMCWKRMQQCAVVRLIGAPKIAGDAELW